MGKDVGRVPLGEVNLHESADNLFGEALPYELGGCAANNGVGPG